MSAEYFSDVNPRTLTRVTNICAFIARLLHASGVSFNWYNLTAWVNVSEQWPYHLSWILFYIESTAATATSNYDLRTPIGHIYNNVKKVMPSNDTSRFMDKSPLKLEAALNNDKPLLTLGDVVTFLRFTVNLDPYLRRMVREHANAMRNLNSPFSTASGTSAGALHRQSVHMLSSGLQMKPVGKQIVSMTVDDVIEMMSKIPYISKQKIDMYAEALRENNICGPVLANCELSELRKALPMTFGDWQLFSSSVSALRNGEMDGSFNLCQISPQNHGLVTFATQVSEAPVQNELNPNSAQNDPRKALVIILLLKSGFSNVFTFNFQALQVPSANAEVINTYVTPDSTANEDKTPVTDTVDSVDVDRPSLPASVSVYKTTVLSIYFL